MKPPKKSKRPYKIFTKTNPTDAQWTRYKSYRTAAQMEQGFADLIAHRSNHLADAPWYQRYKMIYPDQESIASACQSDTHPKSECHGGIWECAICRKRYCETEGSNHPTDDYKDTWLCVACNEKADALNLYLYLRPKKMGVKGGPDPNPELTKALIQWLVESEVEAGLL